MALREEWEAQGQWLFRWRSYLPFVLLLMVIQACMDFEYPKHRHDLQEAWMLYCLFVSLCGLGLRIHVAGHTPKGTSGRGTEKPKGTLLNTDGWYSVVRHPLYLANFLIWLGIGLFFHHLWLTVAFCAVFWLYYERIMFAEEEFLRKKFGDEFLCWANSTPTFIPRFSQWRAPNLPMSWRKAIRLEYTTVFAILMGFGALESVEHLVVDGRIYVERHWRFILPAGILAYGIMMILKKRYKLFCHCESVTHA